MLDWAGAGGYIYYQGPTLVSRIFQLNQLINQLTKQLIHAYSAAFVS